MSNTIALLGCVLGFCGAFAASKPTAPVSIGIDASSEQYKACTALVKDKPEVALRIAGDWLTKENSPAALHCRALAKYGMKQFDAAGRDLESLAYGVGKGQPKLWTNLARQAATAYSLAGQKDKASAVLLEAVALADSKQVNDMLPGLLLDRANIHLEQKKPLFAVQDMDQLLANDAKNADALVIRARAQEALGLKDGALKDLTSALAVDATHKEALDLKKKLDPTPKATAKKPVKKKPVKKKSGTAKKPVKKKKSS